MIKRIFGVNKRLDKRQLSDRKKKIMIAAVIVLLIVIIDAIILIGNKKQQGDTGNQKTSISSTEIGNYRRASDGQVQFSVNPRKVQTAIDELGQNRPAQGSQFVTVEVNVKNDGKEGRSLQPSNQILVTTNNKRAAGSASLQALAKNGDWYKNIPAGKITKGMLVFEISTNDSISTIEFRLDESTKSAKLRLN